MTRPELEAHAAGLTIERRGLLWLPALAALGATPAVARPRDEEDDAGEGPLDLAGLAAELEARAAAHAAGGRVNVDAYLHGLQALGARLAPDAIGDVELRDFGGYDPPGEPGAFTMRKTLAQLLRPGLSSTLHATRDNVHTFLAGPEGAVGVDLNTIEPGEGDWSMLAYEEGKRADFLKTYEATWTGKPGAADGQNR